MNKFQAILITIVSLNALPVVAQADFATKVSGAYSTGQTDFVTVKRMTFTKEKDGSIKIRAALMGFPEEVSLGESTPEVFRERRGNGDPALLATFSSTKFKPFMVIRPGREIGIPGGFGYESMSYTCYMTDIDGKKVHIGGILERQKD